VSETSDLAIFFGRFHPLLVHLPIGIIVVLAFFELLARNPRYRGAAANAGYLLAVAVPVSLVTALLGWLLSLDGGYNTRLLDWHFWTGILTTGLCTLAAVFYKLDMKKAYRGCLFLTFPALLLASHFGGSLTHGSDYLVRYAPGPIRSMFGGKPVPPQPAVTLAAAEKPAFETVILPILENNCISCHGPERARGSLRADSIAFLLEGGKGGPAVIPGNSAGSELIKRIRLPIDHDDHMPPAGKPQPSPDDLTLLAWWIDTGASGEHPAMKLAQTPEVRRILNTSEPDAVPEVKPRLAVIPRDQALRIASDFSGRMSVAIGPLSESEPWLVCNASIAGEQFDDQHLILLAQSPIAPNVLWLDLAGTAITDAGLAAITNFQTLRRLHLSRTPVTDSGMACVGALDTLEYLNLYDTQVSDSGLQHLGKLPKLSHVYLWGTAVSPEGAKSLASARFNETEKSRIEREIETLQARLKSQEIFVNIGAVGPEQPSAEEQTPTPDLVNTACPISGKPVDKTKTLEFEGKTYAFCCDDCLEKAKKDPKTVLVKLLEP
jgi:YHS domain-containing protein/uncharacterized membrane protein